MNTRDNAKVMEKLEQTALFAYFEKLMETEMHRQVLFSIFPYTAAANLSDPHPLVMIDDLSQLASLNSGSFLN
jgi:hypothetical protein